MTESPARIRSLADLDALATAGRKTLYPEEHKILVGMGTCGRAAGAEAVLEAAREEARKLKFEIAVVPVGCIGWCSEEPLMDVWLPGRGRLTYGHVKPAEARKIVRALASGHAMPAGALAWMESDDNLLTGRRTPYHQGRDGFFPGVPEYAGLPLFARQLRIIFRNCGLIDPSSLEEYVARGGYYTLARALAETSPEEIVQTVKRSGLRGRGGAGFPTGIKWEALRANPNFPHYVICNADEGDPGAYMDRGILEGSPHSVLEGMILGGYALGASEGFIYVRAEYPLAVEHLRVAIRQGEEYGLLGENILGTDFSFRIRLVQGAGAFVCGEETALIASIEGRVGEPHPRPPFPVQQGLWRKPTVINNVKTWSTIPVILERGAEWYASIGTERSKGTTVFSLVGKINNTGLVEVPMGITLREMIYEIGGGIPKGKQLKAVQIGGPSGGCIPASLIDLPIDYEKLTEAGSMMGSGGMVVMDEDTCMVDVARYFLEFLEEESCGKCFPCRAGTQRLRQILARICAGHGRPEDLKLLEDLGWLMKETSLCGLGQTAANPVLTTLRYFRDEYLAHIEEKRCPARVCRELILYTIEPTLCDGCHACVQVCASDAILGEKKAVHSIEAAKCIKCGACLEVCQPKAVLVV
jgi:NADH:ubiquinone oxidoreductase subunit F (NADH-binding)/(2Fe-2S) ferredoxin/Pyruvate/2-oxoacid:ferredoxin oxidoreductase delta subunit